jgi:hypothetical protein
VAINPLKTEFLLNSIYISSPYLIENNTSPLQRPTGEFCLGKQSLFIVRTIHNTQIHSVGRMQSLTCYRSWYI